VDVPNATGPALSVVVIAYNDAAGLPVAVRSVLRQTFTDLELVIVDDASTDGTAGVADQLAASDPRVSVLRRTRNSGGCSAPRNDGVRATHGRWVMFLDSDDELYPDAAQVLIKAGEATGADVAAGITVRHEAHTRAREPWFPELFTHQQVITSLHDHVELLQDTLSTNKAFRRSFLDDNDLRFVEEIHYEDQVFSLQVYLAMHRLVVVPERVYRWNVRPSAGSITNQRAELSNVQHRLAANRLIDAALEQHGDPDVLRAKDVKFVRNDLRVYLNDLWQRDEDYRASFLPLMGDYLRGLAPESLEALPPVHRAAVLLLRAGDLDGLLDVVEGMRRPAHYPAVLARRDGRLVVDRPAVTGVDVGATELARTASHAARLEAVEVHPDHVLLTVAARVTAEPAPRRETVLATARVAPIGARPLSRRVWAGAAVAHDDPDLWRVRIPVPFDRLARLPGPLRSWTVLLELDGTTMTVGRPRAWAGDIQTPVGAVTLSVRGDLRLVSASAASTARELDHLRLRLRRTVAGSAYRAVRKRFAR